jgi:outer membrane receptor protein involved in Fe transport
MLKFPGTFILLLTAAVYCHAQPISGVIRDASGGESIIGASVSLKGSKLRTVTDINGRFELTPDISPPYVLIVSFVGYEQQEVPAGTGPVTVRLKAREVNLKDVEITGSRVSEKQRESALTVESIDIIAIKECPQTSFYEALGTLKGVDLTSASLGFTVINTRGFNSTSPVRSLQLIDGVDNQSPGLNFSLGNFLGSSELDVLKVDLIAGASTAYYGPNAFNGVISMTTRSPFVKPGLEVSVRYGERNLLESAVRWSQVLKNRTGEEKWGYKLNLYYLRADDWVADNRSATPESRQDTKNPGGYDAVNTYGDEYYVSSDFSKQPATNPGLIAYYRTGYQEKDLVDYDTRNLKLGAAVHYKVKPENEIILASNFGNGTTVYQGDNRYSLKDILFFQHRIEYRKQDKFFIRAYTTNEDAGKSYDAFFTALLLQRASKSDIFWSQNYRSFWALPANQYFNRERNFPGYPQPPSFGDPDYAVLYQQYLDAINPFLLNNYYDSLVLYHSNARIYTDNLEVPSQNQIPFFLPGTARFDSAFAAITSSKSFSEGGSRFYDKSALYHLQGEYKFTPKFMNITTGGNYRLYRPKSDGTIFSDTAGGKIENYEWGFYSGFEKKIIDDKITVSATARLDKNENFDYLFSPAGSATWNINKDHLFRFSFSSAIRNPTLTDQYLFYNVGRATLIGNISGYDSLVTIPSLIDATSGFINIDKLVYFNIAPVKPERVKTFEVGYRASLFGHLYLDANYYYSVYRDFIGYKVGAKVTAYRTPFSGDQLTVNNIYRVSSNADDKVNSQGFSIGLNYFIGKFFSASGNYSWNELNKRGSDDPIIPAYNTPRNKYNLGFSGRDIDVYLGNKIHLVHWGFNVNYKWVQGFLFEGSPQFTGEIDDYSVVDMQVNKKIPALKMTLKAGASNVLNRKHYEVYGGPEVGRLAYFSVLVELN